MTDTTELFLITGATGKTGAPTVGLLRERGFRVRAFVHALDDRATRLREQGAEVVQGDLLNFDAVSSALVGVSAAYFCYPIDPPRLLEATAIFAQAATEANVGAVVNMSQSPARREAQYYGPREHWIAERLLDRTHMMTTHLRPTLFADWLSWQWLRHDGQGVLRLPFGNARHAPIASADQARVIAAILANPEPHDRQIYPLYGPEELDHHAIAQKMSQTLHQRHHRPPGIHPRQLQEATQEPRNHRVRRNRRPRALPDPRSRLARRRRPRTHLPQTIPITIGSDENGPAGKVPFPAGSSPSG
jgi:uncharacterized protein YbjT (DUF2867 family)